MPSSPNASPCTCSIGKSVLGQDMWALDITKQGRYIDMLKTNFKYSANMHGDETSGRCVQLVATGSIDQLLA